MAPGRGRRRARSQGGTSRQFQDGSRNRRGTNASPRGMGSTLRRSRRLSNLRNPEEEDSSAPAGLEALNDTTEELGTRNAQAEATRQRQREQRRERRALEAPSELEHSEPALTQARSETQHNLQTDAVAKSTNEVDAELDRFELTVVVQPPDQAKPDQALSPPLAVELKPRKLEEQTENAAHIEDLYAVASLMDETGNESLAPPSTTLLVGTPVAPVRLLSLLNENNREGQGDIEPATRTHTTIEENRGYLWFPDLCITQTGRFRFRISLISRLSPETEAVTLQTVDSRVIQIHANPVVDEPTAEERRIIHELQQHQSIVRSPDQ